MAALTDAPDALSPRAYGMQRMLVDGLMGEGCEGRGGGSVVCGLWRGGDGGRSLPSEEEAGGEGPEDGHVPGDVSLDHRAQGPPRDEVQHRIVEQRVVVARPELHPPPNTRTQAQVTSAMVSRGKDRSDRAPRVGTESTRTRRLTIPVRSRCASLGVSQSTPSPLPPPSMLTCTSTPRPHSTPCATANMRSYRGGRHVASHERLAVEATRWRRT